MPQSEYVSRLIYAPDRVVVDVRSPQEYHRGHIPGSINLPLLTNDERAAVGTAYVQVGRERAIELGMEFVAPRLSEFVNSARKLSDKPIVMYCARGGMRSATLAWFLETVGYSVTTITRGYKAYRSMVLSDLESTWPFVVIGGYTGSGKTQVLHELRKRGKQVLDLEGLCNHRGSAFGALQMQPQPRSEHAMNLIHQALCAMDVTQPIYVEDESQHIGSVWLHEPFFRHLRQSPLTIINVPRSERAKHLADIYGSATNQELIGSFLKIRKPLGGDRLKEALDALATGDIVAAATIALDHYDRAYEFGMSKRMVAPTSVIDAPNVDIEHITNMLTDLHG